MGQDGGRDRQRRDAVLAGDAAAWRQWYDDHFDRLAGYVRWRCGGLPDLADDVIQETWLTAVRRLRQFDPARGPFFGWLCGLAANAARNAVRGRRRYARRVGPLATDPDPSVPDVGAEAFDGGRVAAALAALPDHYESVLRAKYLDRLSVGQIAADTGATAKAVESLLTRAREAFKKEWHADDADQRRG